MPWGYQRYSVLTTMTCVPTAGSKFNLFAAAKMVAGMGTMGCVSLSR